jgi:Flagellar transcriptional activator (FlhC)
MEIHVTDDAIGRYFRRYQLAARMVSHGARAQTVCDWSGLTPDQLVTLRRRWGFDPDERRRGPAPSAFRIFFKSKRHQSEASLFACMCRIVGATTARYGEDAAKRLPNIENGERLCEAFEAYREWQPDAELDFEHAVQLARGTVEQKAVALDHCPLCHAAMLIDRLDADNAVCPYCQRTRHAIDPRVLSARQKRDCSVIKDYKQSETQGEQDHVPERIGASSAGDFIDDGDQDAENKNDATKDLDRRSKEK